MNHARAPRPTGRRRPSRPVPRTVRRALTVLAVTALAAAAGAPGATAHPLGNFTVNYHTGLTLYPDRIDARIVVDRAEISALQERAVVDRDHDGDIGPAEARSYAAEACADLGRRLHVRVVGARGAARTEDVGWKAASAAALVHEPGEAGLKTSRLTCELTAPAGLTEPAGLSVRTGYDTGRIGWRELTATGRGVRITRSDVPAASVTRELRAYPQDPLASPLDQRAATLRTEPGPGAGAAPAVADLPGAGLLTGLLGKVTGVFDALVGAREITLPVGLLALLLALVLGASHAAMPGHGKTIMAAYLAGRRGTRRDAVTVGATVTLTHTTGVLVLGLALPAATHLAGESVLVWLGAASGLLVTGIGLWLLTGALRGKSLHHHHHHHDAPDHHAHDHGAPHDHDHDHDHGHGHAHDHDHAHDHGHAHSRGHGHGDHGPAHGHAPGTVPDPAASGSGALIPARRGAPGGPAGAGAESRAVATLAPASRGQGHEHHHGHEHHQGHGHDHGHRPATAPAPGSGPRRANGRAGLIGMGIAGGLVPSPSALVVLLGAVALGRTAFGVLLVIGYGLGMAVTLTLAGLLLVRVRERLETHHRARALRTSPLLRRLVRTGPVLTSLLVIAVGCGLTVRAATGTG
ncbi:nickel transporter [Streptomyces subrutilus]|nr:nickel transporter [Streptomyces subrutilus]